MSVSLLENAALAAHGAGLISQGQVDQLVVKDQHGELFLQHLRDPKVQKAYLAVGKQAVARAKNEPSLAGTEEMARHLDEVIALTVAQGELQRQQETTLFISAISKLLADSKIRKKPIAAPSGGADPLADLRAQWASIGEKARVPKLEPITREQADEIVEKMKGFWSRNAGEGKTARAIREGAAKLQQLK